MTLTAEQAAAAIVGSGGKFGWRVDGAIEIAVAGGVYLAAPPGPKTAVSHQCAAELRRRVELTVERVLRGFAAEYGLRLFKRGDALTPTTKSMIGPSDVI